MVVNAKGKSKRVYRWYATPWEILRQLPGLAGHLKEDITIEGLERIALVRGVEVALHLAEREILLGDRKCPCGRCGDWPKGAVRSRW